uniref:NR LBD domain-containing protein n=1 Tax=Caenorhabditis japonica TaxID=281687 RepID=A0A8R1IQ63_CAEJA
MFFVPQDGFTPKLCNYQELRDEHTVDKKLIIENFLPFFQLHAPMIEEQQQMILDSNFMITFVLLERAFQSQHGKYFVMASGCMIDTNDLMKFYRNPEELDDDKAMDAKTLLGPYWRRNNQILGKHLKEVKLDVDEFLLIVALIYWDFGG